MVRNHFYRDLKGYISKYSKMNVEKTAKIPKLEKYYYAHTTELKSYWDQIFETSFSNILWLGHVFATRRSKNCMIRWRIDTKKHAVSGLLFFVQTPKHVNRHITLQWTLIDRKYICIVSWACIIFHSILHIHLYRKICKTNIL